MSLPDISVIVPVYKVEAYLNECVDSILAQTFQNIEVILVDDGSPDRCGEICDKYAQRDARVRVIHQQNVGLSCARNAGIQVADGRYLCFVDSDDLVSSNYCETLFNLLDGTEYDFSVCGVLRYLDGGVIQELDDNSEVNIMSNEAFLEAQLCGKTEFGVWNKLYRRELFEHIQFMQKKIHEDVIWSADLAKHLKKGVICTSKKLYYYRQRNSGIVAEGSRKCNPDRIFAGEYLVEVVRNVYPSLLKVSLRYAINYPWMFIDKIYVKRRFLDNKVFMRKVQEFLKKYKKYLIEYRCFDRIITHRMNLFAKSKVLYGINAYTRLVRVSVYNKLLKKDAYVNGHGI